MQASAGKEEATVAGETPAPDAGQRNAKDERRRSDERVERAYGFADLADYSLKQRVLIRFADLVFYLLINIIGRTIRLQVEGWQHWEQAVGGGRLPIYTFWHDRILLGTYFWRARRIVVMTSRSFDGEYIARFIQRFGYGVARGSSTRGRIGALAEMVRLVKLGCPTAFTIDGPRGPRHVAKMGAVLLAKKTGQPILPFSFDTARYIEVPSWDRLQIPLPFTRVRTLIGAPIYVPRDADDAMLEAKRDELQRALEALSNSETTRLNR